VYISHIRVSRREGEHNFFSQSGYYLPPCLPAEDYGVTNVCVRIDTEKSDREQVDMQLAVRQRAGGHAESRQTERR